MKENVIQISGRTMINVDVSVKKCHVCEKNFFWNPVTCSCKNGKDLASIMDQQLFVMKL